MRGMNWTIPAPNSPDEAVEEAAVMADKSGSNLEKNTELARKPGSVWWWLTLIGLYFAWDYFQTRGRLSDAIKPANIRANWHNLVVIGIAAVIVINGFNILLTKLAAMRIPVVSRVAGAFLPLFNL